MSLRIRKTLLVIVVFLLSSAYAMSQTRGELLSLDKYTIPMNAKGARIGTVCIPDGGVATLIKDTAHLFMIDNQRQISLKKNKVLNKTSPIRYEITIAYGGKTKTVELVKDEFLKNTVVAHRGAWKHHNLHQNSLGALKKAIEIGCEGSEFDVWLSKDKQVVLNHDHEIDGLIVEETDLVEMRKIILEQGEVMATLQEYIACIKTQNKTRLVLEVKSNKNVKSIPLADSVVNIVHRMKAQAWVDYISFDYNVLLRIRALDTNAHLAYLGADRPMDLQKVEHMSGIDYHFSQFDKIERLYDRARELELTINIWTVNEEPMMKKLLDLGVDFITTDEPQTLLKVIEANRKQKTL